MNTTTKQNDVSGWVTSVSGWKLTDEVRAVMADEYRNDMHTKSEYLNHIAPENHDRCRDLFVTAIQEQDGDWLHQQFEPYYIALSNRSHDAGWAEFNRYYMRAICLHFDQVQTVRLRRVDSPTTNDSVVLDSSDLLKYLRLPAYPRLRTDPRYGRLGASKSKMSVKPSSIDVCRVPDRYRPALDALVEAEDAWTVVNKDTLTDDGAWDTARDNRSKAWDAVKAFGYDNTDIADFLVEPTRRFVNMLTQQ